jgi:hypothetical protein
MLDRSMEKIAMTNVAMVNTSVVVTGIFMATPYVSLSRLTHC